MRFRLTAAAASSALLAVAVVTMMSAVATAKPAATVPAIGSTGPAASTVDAAAPVTPGRQVRVNAASPSGRSVRSQQSPTATTVNPPGRSTPAPLGTRPAVRPAPGPTPIPPADNLAGRLRTLPPDTRQVIIVHAGAASSTTATLETFSKGSGSWSPALGAMAARVGSRGIGAHTQEGVPVTPAGVYGIGATMYGINADPGSSYSWHHLVSGDYWDENPSSPTYNTFVHGADPGGNSEALWQISPAYNYFAVIMFNMPEVVPGRGSAIFLHVGTGGPTAGCVSLAAADLVKVLTWLDPVAHPQIVIATDAGLASY